MPTKLNSNVVRVTDKRISGRDVVVTLAPMRGQAEAIFYFRLLGKRTNYPLALSDAYRYAALMFGQREAKAKREARRMGIPWKRAKRAFVAAMSPPNLRAETPEQ